MPKSTIRRTRSRNQGSSTEERSTQARRQGIYWILTIPHEHYTPYNPPGICYSKGQLEEGDSETAYVHWQFIIICRKKESIASLRRTYGPYHAELTRSEAAEDYVWKEETRIEGTQFEIGERPFRRNQAKDWEEVWDQAVEGNITNIPADIRIRCYNTLKKIQCDYAKPVAQERTCKVFWGPTHTGKSETAWEEAGEDAYPKDPRTKFWCGYRGQENVVIDELRGDIDIGHLLRWLDRYPVIVETKGSALSLNARKFWITSNLHPRDWFPGLDEETKAALMRRLDIIQFHRRL